MHFWSLHFGPILNLVPKLILLLGQSLISKNRLATWTSNRKCDQVISYFGPVTENAYVANGMHCLLTRC